MRKLIVIAVCALSALLVAPARAAAETDLGCGNRTDLQVTVKPRTCFLNWPDVSLAESVTLRQIVWHNWGRSTATARAVFRVKTNEPFTRVTARAFRRRQCGAEAYLYTRVQVRFPGGRAHTWRTPNCTEIGADD
jgi:hypothetical protein